MNPFTQRLTAFFLCMVIGCGLTVTLTRFTPPPMTIPPVHMVQSGEIQEITMEVSNGWCSAKSCGDYTIVFQRPDREGYYASVTRIEFWSREIKTGDIANADFNNLAQVIESQSFFELDSGYPKNTWCTDCRITKVSVLKDGRRKKVVSLNGEMPLQLWTIQRTVESVAEQVQWLKH